MTKANKIKILNKVIHVLSKQGKYSLNGGNLCAYRGHGGTKCAIGALIPDKKYDSSFEGQGLAGNAASNGCIIRATGIRNSQSNVEFLSSLQKIHDQGAIMQINFSITVQRYKDLRRELSK